LESFFQWWRWLYDTTGINLTIFYDAFDRARFVGGFFTTLKISASCIVLSVLIGILGAWLQGARLGFTRHLLYGYIQFFRNTPPLVQLYFFYFGLGAYLKTAGGEPIVTNVSWAILGLSMYAGAFNIEIFRSGIESVPRATVEAATSFGFSRLQAYRHIVLPLALRVCLPALNNNLVNLVKTTSIAYAIAVPEMLYVAAQIWSDSNNVKEMMNVLLLCYVALVGVFVYIMNRWERAMKMPGFGA
jgi:polar amino acid transport system permease protein